MPGLKRVRAWQTSCVSIFSIVCALAMAGCTALPGGSETKGYGMDKEVCVYAGSGAVLARDVEVALDKSAIPYSEVDEHVIRRSRLGNCSLLIIPGGYTVKYVNALGEEGFEGIREFVAGGGGYIGICAGAYIAARTVEVPGHPPGLGIIEIKNERGAGRGIRSITVTKPEHPVVEGCGKALDIWYKNGAMIKAEEGVETLAIYREGFAAIVCSTYGEGKVVIFSTHPEGSLEGGVDPKKLGTLKLLENAITFASKSRK